MGDSVEPRERRYVKGDGFLSFARSMGTHATKVTKNLSNKYGQKLVDSAKKYAADAFKIARKIAIQKTAEATRDLVAILLQTILQVFKKKPSK